MEKTIEIAKCTLAYIFDIRKDEFDKQLSRMGGVSEAKRFLVYFLCKELGIKFYHIPKYMGCFTSHASAMHHYYKMIDLMELESKTRIKYIDFKNQMLEKGMDKLEKELLRQIEIRKVVTCNIKELKNMINEA